MIGIQSFFVSLNFVRKDMSEANTVFQRSQKQAIKF